MEERETARMRKYGESKRLELWWQLYRTSLPVWDLENFGPMDFCWHECTTDHPLPCKHRKLPKKWKRYRAPSKVLRVWFAE